MEKIKEIIVHQNQHIEELKRTQNDLEHTLTKLRIENSQLCDQLNIVYGLSSEIQERKQDSYDLRKQLKELESMVNAYVEDF